MSVLQTTLENPSVIRQGKFFYRLDWFDCVFYSFVTLTSLGYGDIVPMTAQAWSLSILEAVSGIMYVAVRIARLVGLPSAGKSQANPEIGRASCRDRLWVLHGYCYVFLVSDA